MFGADLVRKLIMRRLTTNKGEFFHLPNYGISLPFKLPIPTAQLIKLKTEIESQVKLEPDVSNVRATVSLDPQGILFISISATYSPSGQTFQVPIVIQPGTVQL
jgi:phage baseplate assembly protein W